jgi:sterol desaturase/sphingolipid hydroxylase (fatty acid hydroxylase superfamily)
MKKYFDIFITGFTDYWNYIIHDISNPSWNSYFYLLIAVSVLFYALEIIFPWRKGQKLIRKDFWLDFFYMFFNFFIFSLIIYNSVSNVFVSLFNDFLALFGITNIVAIKIDQLAVWMQLIILFLARDFIQWNVHRLLHAVPFLWQFHKVHHSVKEMGFAAHLRFHWMETIVYKFIQYVPLAMLGFGLVEFFIVDAFALAVGHFNHSNFKINLGPLKYVFNSPQMHIWHHAKELPKDRKMGVNFGLTLSIWDYLFKTAYIPHDGRDIELGFDDEHEFPQNFIKQELYPFVKNERTRK